LTLTMTELPACSVVIPCRNEIRFIEPCLRSLLANDYPLHRLEIIAVDGGSTDGTRELLARYAARHAHLVVLDNPNGIIPVSMNMGIHAARGAAVLKADAHTIYSADYISRNVRHLRESGADNVGGVLETCAADDSAIATSIARVLAHPFGSGNSRFRIGSDGPVDADTVAFGCYPREVLARMGGYNEALVRSSDMDLNNRIRRAGGRIMLIPDIVSRYYPRAAFWSFVARNWVDGFWVTYPSRFGGEVLRPRHVAPLAALLVLALAAGLSLLIPAVALAIGALLGVYTALLLAASVQIGARERRLRVGLVTPAVFAGRHLAYAFGSLWGLVRVAAAGGRADDIRVSPKRPAARAHDDAWWAPFREPRALSIVIPAFNEERRLPAAIEAIDRYLAARALGYEIIVVDDGSTDRTAEIVNSLAASRLALRLIRLPHNQGKGAAVKAGMLAASGRWVVFTDADQSTSIDQLPALLEPALDGFDIAMGSRALPGSTLPSKQRWYRRALARVFGAHGEQVRQPRELEGALQRAFASGKPAVIDVMIDQHTLAPVVYRPQAAG